MLSALSRLLQASPVYNSDHDGASVESAGDTRGSGPPLTSADDSGLGLETARLERRPSVDASVVMDARRRAPSHVSWKTPNAVNPTPSPISDSLWSSQYESHSASAPSLLLLNPGSTVAKASSIHRHSSQSLRTPSVTASEDWSRRNSPEKRDSIELHPARLAPPLNPHVRFPGGRRPSTDSVPLTPDSTRVHDGRECVLTSASASQTSTSTNASVTPQVPTIPPLDLRPDFQKTIGPPIRKSRLPPQILPTVIGSPHPGKYSVIYEDGSSARSSRSFVTAPSVHSMHRISTPEPGSDTHAEERTPHARDYAMSNGSSIDVTPAVRTSGLPEGLYDIDLGEPSRVGSSTHLETRSTDTSPRVTQPLLPVPPSAVPRRPRSVSSSGSDTYIYNRWLKGFSIGSGNYELHIPRALSQKRVRSCLPEKMEVTSACFLFWLGFIGPWCWLIGGWMLTTEGELAPEFKHAAAILPLWTRHGKKSDATAERDKAKNLLAFKLYPLVAPSVESLTPSVQHRRSPASTRRLKSGALQGVDVWVIRCRIAAIMSGVLILAALIVALIVAASRY
ncbi:hypothetical protein DAEQUDRAFT_753011 [Daedalea quercina L-15889]|uniref:Uncharacterized protein n=1 Tax=Daedalea quercina L-15889 TaxID=1314783 RepID=A0A165LF16_9APHY|nr:hypothetical protein DAEQUDRAFT_753011 [Daedalea quercina L-15889]